MKTNAKIGTTSLPDSLPALCLNSCRRLLAQIERVRTSVLREFAGAVAGHRRLLELGMHEAEALAWQTAYPHLLFPVLAEEKAAEVSHWVARQRNIRGQSARISRELLLQPR